MLKKYLNISIFIVVFNLAMGAIFLHKINNIQAETFQILEKKFDKKCKRITALINLISSYYKAADFNALDDLENHLRILEANLGSKTFNFSNVIIADINGKVVFATHPCSNNNCSVKHRDYLSKSLNSPKKVHQGELVDGIISNAQAIPFSKALENNNKVYGVIIIGLDIKEFNNSMIQHSYLNFKVSVPNNKTYWNNLIFQQLVKTINGSKYELEVIPNHELLVKYIKFILPWNIIFLIVSYIVWQVQKGKHKIILLYNHLFSKDAEVDYFRENTLHDPYKITSNILTKVAELIKDYQFNISNIEKTVAELIKEVRFNEIETARLGQELINLIKDKNVNLNDEYITMFKELHGNIADSIEIAGSLLSLLQQNLPSTKGRKEDLKLNNLILCLPSNFKYQRNDDDWYIKVYIQPFHNLIDLITEYILLLCKEDSCGIEIVIDEEYRISLVFSAILKDKDNKYSFTQNNEALYYYKIKLLAQINSANLEVTDKDNQLKLVLEFPLKKPINNKLQSN